MWAVWTLIALFMGLHIPPLLTSVTWARDSNPAIRPSLLLPPKAFQVRSGGLRQRPLPPVIALSGVADGKGRAKIPSSRTPSYQQDRRQGNTGRRVQGRRSWPSGTSLADILIQGQGHSWGTSSGMQNRRTDGDRQGQDSYRGSRLRPAHGISSSNSSQDEDQSSTSTDKGEHKRHRRALFSLSVDNSTSDPRIPSPVTQKTKFLLSTCYASLIPTDIRQSSCNGGVWSCAGRCGQFHQYPCSCHANCRVYRTCCADFHNVCSGADSFSTGTTTAHPFSEFSNFALFSDASSSMSPLTSYPPTTPPGIHVPSADEDPFSFNLSDLQPPNQPGFFPPPGIVMPSLQSPTPNNGIAILEWSSGDPLSNVTALPSLAPDSGLRVLTSYPQSHRVTGVVADDESAVESGGGSSSSSSGSSRSSSSSSLQSLHNRRKRRSVPISDLHAKCELFSSAMLVRNCPVFEGFKILVPRERTLCEETIVPTISFFMPVTDPVTGVHFANVHCYNCWVAQYADTSEISDIPPPLYWQGEFTLRPDEKLLDEHSQSNIISILLNFPEKIKMSSPAGFPHHWCDTTLFGDFLTRQCPPCPILHSDPEINQLCRTETGFVRNAAGHRTFHKNKHCLYCHTAHDVYVTFNHSGDEKNLTQAILDSISELQCQQPYEGDVHTPAINYAIDTVVTVHWDNSTRAWIFSNTGSLEVSPDDSFLNWTQLQCTDFGCTALSCKPFSVIRAGRCVPDLAPYFSVLYLCITATSDTEECITEVGQANSTPAAMDQVMGGLEKEVLEALMELAPWKFDAGPEHTNVSTNVSTNHGLVFTVISETSALSPNGVRQWVDPEAEQFAFERVVSAAERLGLEGWATVCLQDQLYSAAHPKLPSVKCSSFSSKLSEEANPSSRSAACLPAHSARSLLLCSFVLLAVLVLVW